MTRDQINVALAAILETLASDPDHTAPIGPMYAAFMATHEFSVDDVDAVFSIAATAGLIARGRSIATLTPRGENMVAQIRAHRAA